MNNEALQKHIATYAEARRIAQHALGNILAELGVSTTLVNQQADTFVVPTTEDTTLLYTGLNANGTAPIIMRRNKRQRLSDATKKALARSTGPAARVAKRLGVTEQTVYKYRKLSAASAR